VEKRTLGKTGLHVSRLGAGLAEIGELKDASTAANVLNVALDGGIDYLDTAACYGESEAWIGRTIVHRRDEYVLGTKAGHVVGGATGQEWAAETIRESIERSLVRMRTDHLDLVQLHSCEIEVLERGEAIRALQDARQFKKVLELGPIADAPADRIALFLGFALAHSDIDTAILGTGNPAHMRANLQVFETMPPLPRQVIEELYHRFTEIEEIEI
jgi:aryl-alcohol dehydrogenase-like predicted oxidoreductase